MCLKSIQKNLILCRFFGTRFIEQKKNDNNLHIIKSGKGGNRSGVPHVISITSIRSKFDHRIAFGLKSGNIQTTLKFRKLQLISQHTYRLRTNNDSSHILK